MFKAQEILSGLGGADNVRLVESCITRLRVEVQDPKKVDHDALSAAGVFGVILVGDTAQVVVGPEADDLAATIQTIL